jgi:hypothetical protein
MTSNLPAAERSAAGCFFCSISPLVVKMRWLLNVKNRRRLAQEISEPFIDLLRFFISKQPAQGRAFIGV